MKVISILFFFLFLSGSSWSQHKIDKRLLSRYSESELASMKTSNPDNLKVITYALDSGMYIANYSAEKGEVYPEIERPKKNQTYLDLNFEILDENQYFKIKGEEKMLIIKSKWLLNNEMK